MKSALYALSMIAIMSAHRLQSEMESDVFHRVGAPKEVLDEIIEKEKAEKEERAKARAREVLKGIKLLFEEKFRRR